VLPFTHRIQKGEFRMNVKTLLAAAALAILPGLSFAMCSGDKAMDQQAMSCAEGTQWDAQTATCIPVTTS
jgi:hypothetical protein